MKVPGGGGALPPPSLTPTVATLIVANVVTFLAKLSTGFGLVRHFALWPLVPSRPSSSHFELWQLCTYGFLHGTWGHLAFNMLALWMFGHVLERDWGSVRLAVYYIACVMTAGATHLAFAAAGFDGGIVVGASGGVFGLLLAFALRYPNTTILPVLPPIPMRASTLALLYGVAALLFGVSGKLSFIAHFAHLGGMVGGLVLIFALPGLFGARRAHQPRR